jgi:hypothetical protein
MWFVKLVFLIACLISIHDAFDKLRVSFLCQRNWNIKVLDILWFAIMLLMTIYALLIL